MMWKYLGALLLLLVSAWQDGKTRQIRKGWLRLQLLAGFAGHVVAKSLSWDLAAAAMIGIVLSGAARVSGQKIGRADSWLITALGVYIGFWETAAVLLGAFACSSLYGVLLLLRRRISLRGEIPFAPFVLGSYLLLLIGKVGG